MPSILDTRDKSLYNGVHKRTSSFFTRSWRGPSRLSFADVTLIIIESALLYTTTVIICVVLDLANSNAYYGATDVSLEVAGISFDLIIIRIWTGVSTEQTQAFTDTVENLSKIKAGASEQVITAHSGFTDLNTWIVASRDDMPSGVTMMRTPSDVSWRSPGLVGNPTYRRW
ncbi:uncharacterized protein B0H18DRAFT_218602 [Fomitopsis serialis]|uniref:uncharacterized protein n=1 Tax=Fomitopsis serialis TaxID=139415 RepID=UPI0020084FBD|nr:uncharacterized protein B0H18DRAFT_218602 [Neoantrodia serialis]KAH9913021.1 hypothetical protein B0H18DRAFT_218602 [Neoantrodia serialis]